MVLLHTVLPHPDMPAGNETVTVATKGKEQNLQMIPGVESSVYTRSNDPGRFWINYTYRRNGKNTPIFSAVYESMDTYGNILQDNMPSTTTADYCIAGAH